MSVIFTGFQNVYASVFGSYFTFSPVPLEFWAGIGEGAPPSAQQAQTGDPPWRPASPAQLREAGPQRRNLPREGQSARAPVPQPDPALAPQAGAPARGGRSALHPGARTPGPPQAPVRRGQIHLLHVHQAGQARQGLPERAGSPEPRPEQTQPLRQR